MPAYYELFPIGTHVRIRDRGALEQYRRPTWKFHHPILDEQLSYAQAVGTVERVGYYHGGDVLYNLANMPGIWHEACLEAL